MIPAMSRAHRRAAPASPTRRATPPAAAKPPAAHRVAVLALSPVVLFDLATPAQVLARHYDVTICGVEAGPVATTSDVALVANHGLEALARADTVVVPGFGREAWPPPEAALGALRAAHARGARVVSICTGAFALAAAGLLDGRRATTHWRYANALAQAFPAISVEPDVLYVDEGDILTSAGVAAGIDLCLHLVRHDHGAEAANAVARRIVVAPHRGGGQAQFIERPVAPRADQSLDATRAWALEQLDRPLTVAQLAAHAHTSPRTFARRFRAETGTTPLRWLHAQRIEHARRLLERDDLPIEHVAQRCGFGSAAALREHFRRATATTPSAYRRAFGAAA